ncbi:MAG: DUF2786 domain-containing protein [Halobacteriota archaeon]|nr:DUF2786 domain-containing protein [Halobacteriota archaeon]
MEEKKAKMMAILEKMLRLAMDDGASAGEKEVAERKASEIMAKYKIHKSELTLQDKSDPDSGMGRNFCKIIDLNAKWIITLISGLTHVFECKPLLHTGYRQRVTGMEVFGEQDDVETVVEMFNRIQLHITWAAWAELGQNAGARRLRSFCQGASDKVYYRLRKMYQRMQSESVQCRDLVVVKTKQAEDFMNRAVGGTQKMRTKTHDRSGKYMGEYLAGAQAGEKIDLGNARKGQRIE